MKTQKINSILLAAAFFALVQLSFAQEAQKEIAMANTKTESKIDNWVLLGSHVVNYAIDRDVITLNETTERYKSLKFSVKNGELNLLKCTVHFEDADNKDVDFGTSSGQERIVNLEGNTHEISKITFWYGTKVSADQKAVVEVYGKK